MCPEGGGFRCWGWAVRKLASEWCWHGLGPIAKEICGARAGHTWTTQSFHWSMWLEVGEGGLWPSRVWTHIPHIPPLAEKSKKMSPHSRASSEHCTFPSTQHPKQTKTRNSWNPPRTQLRTNVQISLSVCSGWEHASDCFQQPFNTEVGQIANAVKVNE